MYASLGGYLAKDPRSWRVILPDTSSADWLYVQQRLLRGLSSISAGDTVGKRGTVTVSSVGFDNDVAIVRLKVVREYRCDLVQWLGFSAEYEVQSKWLGSRWGNGVARLVQSTDPPPCAAQAPTSNTR